MYMNLNQRRQEIISFAMFKNKITKLQLSKALGMSYPTMLTKLKSTGDFKLREADSLCDYLNIELTEFITLKN
jgi:DNA-binding Xre family transcriptional regulator